MIRKVAVASGSTLLLWGVYLLIAITILSGDQSVHLRGLMRWIIVAATLFVWYHFTQGEKKKGDPEDRPE